MVTRANVAILALILAMFYLQAFWTVRDMVNPAPLMESKIAKLEEELERQRLRSLADWTQMENFRQEVAAALPPALRHVTEKMRDYPLRNLAAVTMKADDQKLQALAASSLFETGKSLFRKGEYERANRLLEKLIDRYGYATQAIEAHFLLAEGQFQLGHLEEASRTIDKMMELFPESELTGFALLRLGSIFETRDRYDEAVQIYRTVLRSFPYRGVASQAERSLRDMEP
jgi:TolA-binding protein